jgi:hypothetical protein
MVGTCGRLARFGLAVGLLVSVAAGCGGDSKTKTIKVPVQPGESASEWFSRALEAGNQVCTGKNPPKKVVFSFNDDDAKTEVAADVVKEKVPTSADCSQYQQQQTQTSANP